jgi:outer membrane protein assembly factor BamD
MFLKRSIIVFALLAAVLSSCNEYQRVLKSTDLDYKLEKAVEYYEDGKYSRALPILDELLTLYRGTQKAEDVYYYYAMTEFNMGNYLVAAYHFKNFYQTFPNNAFADEAAFMVGFCYTKESPTYSLEQSNTFKAINELQLYINTHPNSAHIEECNMLIDEMRAKLERKSFEIAKQYWRTEHYKAAVTSLNTSLNDFPDTPYREEAMFLKLDSAYKLAKNSIVSLQAQRFKQARTAYYDLIAAYPESQHRKQADKIFEDIQQTLDDLNNITENTTNS